MFRHWFSEAAVLPGDLDSLKRQRSVFATVNLFLLLLLLILHSWFSSFWGSPSAALATLLAVSFGLRTLELWWLRVRVVTAHASGLLTTASIALNLALAFVLATVIDREDSQYFALLVVPILESAFRFSLASTLAVITATDAIAFYWVWRYFHVHPPLDIGEYFEAGTISIIFLIAGVMISVMVQHLRRKQAQLGEAHERLLKEEKLAAVGRISSAIVHEIRNPVAMIASSISSAKVMTGGQREVMFDVASQEASRLVKLTNDLLAYARPRRPLPACQSLRDAVVYVADACRAHAAAKSITLQVSAPDTRSAFDLGLVQQALMNLVINAVDASPSDEVVELTIDESDPTEVRVEVENGGGPIASEIVEHLFEPFFSTKSSGTGLGLATARSNARVQGGDLVLANNSERVCFALILPRRWEAAFAAG